MKKSSILAYAAVGVGGAAVAGFGWGMGRDAWRVTKENYLAIVVLLVLFASFILPFLGAQNFLRGHPRRSAIVALAGILGSLFFIVLGASIALGLSIVAFSLLADQPQQETTALAVLFAIVSTAGVILLGLLVGLFQRPDRLRRFAIAEANEEYLDEIGFKETGEEEITHYDDEGNALRLQERTKDAMVF